MKLLERGSSPVDWCEDNYTHSPFIAEFYNTISNAGFLFLPPVLIWLFRPYGIRYNRGVYIIWLMFIVVGVCSSYYHATLSLLGQLLDELAILWIVAASFALWYPHRDLPSFFRHKQRSVFHSFVCGIAIAISALAAIYPAINAFALMTLVWPSFRLLILEMKNCKNSRAVRLGKRSWKICLFGVICWVNDKLFCETWSDLNFPYFHAFWHICIFVSTYTSCVLFAYFDAVHQVPEQNPELKFWPMNKYDLFEVPYVVLSDPTSAQFDSLIKHNKQHIF